MHPSDCGVWRVRPAFSWAVLAIAYVADMGALHFHLIGGLTVLPTSIVVLVVAWFVEGILCPYRT